MGGMDSCKQITVFDVLLPRRGIRAPFSPQLPLAAGLLTDWDFCFIHGRHYNLNTSSGHKLFYHRIVHINYISCFDHTNCIYISYLVSDLDSLFGEKIVGYRSGQLQKHVHVHNILIFTIVHYDSNIIIHVYRIWKQSIKYFIFSYTVQCSLKSLLTHRIISNTNDVESLTEYIIT